MSSLGEKKRTIQVFHLFYNQIVFYVELYELFLYYGYHPLMGHIICKCFIPFSWLFFVLLIFLCSVKTYRVNYVTFFYFGFIYITLDESKKILL